MKERKNPNSTNKPDGSAEKTSSRRRVMQAAASGGLMLGLIGMPVPGLASSGAFRDDASMMSATPKGVRQFFNALLDDKKRQHIEKHPKEELAKFGITIPPGFMKANRNLPPKEEIANLLKIMEQHPQTLQMNVDAYYAFFAFFAFVL